MKRMILCLMMGWALTAHAGVYNQNFDSAANNSTDLGDGSVIAGTQAFVYNPTGTAGFLVLSQDFTGGVIGNYVLPDLDVGKTVTGFTATFDLYFKADVTAADGFSFNFGSMGSTLPYGGEEGMYLSGSMLSVGWDTYDNGSDPQSIGVYVDGVSVANNTAVTPLVDSAFHSVSIVYDATGLDVIYAGTSVFTDLDVSGFSAATGAQFGFAARTGGSYEDAFIDNVSIETIPEPATFAFVGLFGGGLLFVRRIFMM